MIRFFMRFHSAPAKVECDACLSHLRRQHRQGFLQNRILTALGYYPWECPVCRDTLYYRQRNRESSRERSFAPPAA